MKSSLVVSRKSCKGTVVMLSVALLCGSALLPRPAISSELASQQANKMRLKTASSRLIEIGDRYQFDTEAYREEIKLNQRLKDALASMQRERELAASTADYLRRNPGMEFFTGGMSSNARRYVLALDEGIAMLESLMVVAE